jgi:septal ring factor EnvC (AmiA/AmiB activator)
MKMSKKNKRNNEELKIKKIDLRLTEKDFYTINFLCQKANISRSAYIMQAVLNKKVLTGIDIQVVFQLRKIGINLNQISKKIHIISKFVDKKEQKLSDILKEVSSINNEICKLNNHIFSNNNASKS